MTSLERAGWDEFIGKHAPDLAKNRHVGRICLQQKNKYRILGIEGEIPAVISGRLYHKAADPSQLPVIGDWVVYKKTDAHARIESVLPRKTELKRDTATRKGRQRSSIQVIIANVDIIFLVIGLDTRCESQAHRTLSDNYW
ncbi:MAG: hypothetical protein U5R06_06345 [candidate division KSB1 bacterium]|nr:hypothetical protein [candidate division KSB1 bacterium]